MASRDSETVQRKLSAQKQNNFASVSFLVRFLFRASAHVK